MPIDPGPTLDTVLIPVTILVVGGIDQASHHAPGLRPMMLGSGATAGSP